jgi:glutamyl/glutaminyl-tRNA synthetase
VSRPVTRIAPTPSGYLHLGNAVNILLTHWWARAHGAQLVLRIDDFDTGRLRARYLEDVFDTISWLGVGVDLGPADPDDFRSEWSMSARTASFRAAADHLLATHQDSVFVCRCSRRQLDPMGRCVSGCRTAGLTRAPGRSVVRVRVVPGTTARVGPHTVSVPAGDHVLWRRDDLPAYQLGSVVADEELGITAVVRGLDLLDSSALQVHLAGLLPAPGFLSAELVHHELLTAPDGSKLSKSAGAQAHPMDRTPGLLAEALRLAADIGHPLGIGPG